MEILNSAIWEEEAQQPEQLFSNYSSILSSDPSLHHYRIAHSLVNVSSCEYDGIDPCGSGMIFETSPAFVSTDAASLDLSVTSGSPLINAGDNLVADMLGLLYDFAGHPRIQYDKVDIGAFESDSVVSGISEPWAEQESFAWQVRPSVFAAGQSLQLYLLNLNRENTFTCGLYGLAGQEYYLSEIKNVQTQIPVKQVIPTEQLAPGLYFLFVTDHYGRRKTQKLVVHR